MTTSRILDSFDRAILRILQRDNRTPQRSIAEAVNLSTAAVQRRVRTENNPATLGSFRQ